MSTTNLIGDGCIECQYCSREFGDESDLLDHWYRVYHLGDENDRRLTDRQATSAATGHVRETSDRKVSVGVDIEIPEDEWRWALQNRGIVTDGWDIEDLPGPSDLPDVALDLVDETHNYSLATESTD